MRGKKDTYISCIDYSVSNEKFDLVYNNELEMLETFPQPKGAKLASYYESEDYISHTDSKKSLIDKLYQIVKKRALKRKLHLMNSFKSTKKSILDIGCGTGEFLLVCKLNGWNISGVEPNSKARNLAESKLTKDSRLEVVDSIEKLQNKKFDVITLWHVLEHIPDLESYVKNLKSLLKDGGKLVIAVPNFKSFDAKYYKEFWAAYDVPRHLWHFSKASINSLFSQNNMKVEKILPMKYDSFYVSLLSEKYKNGRTNFIKAFLIGLYSNIKAISTKEYSSLIYVIKKA